MRTPCRAVVPVLLLSLVPWLATGCRPTDDDDSQAAGDSGAGAGDAGTAPDASQAPDAGAPGADAGALADAGTAGADAGSADAGGVDASAADAGVAETDAGTAPMDAGVADASAVDASVADAAMPETDAGAQPMDAGVVDVDAGQEAADAGAPPLCTAGTVCDDHNPCTDDSCDPSQGCVFTFNAKPCDDGLLCTIGDTCSNGTCQGLPDACDDGFDCTVDSCDAVQGCLHQAVDTACNDHNPCTDDVCSDVLGCTTFPNTAACDDGDPCTVADSCNNNSCQPGAPRNCDDQVDCTQDHCDSNLGCQHTPVDADCNDSNVCTDDSCDATAGCQFKPNTSPCNDNSLCTLADTCSAGTCKGTPKVCNDGNMCTTDGCVPETGCTVTPIPGCEPLPLDPALLATAVRDDVATNFADAMAFLYSGTDPVQRGADVSAFVPRRLAVVRGLVMDRDGAPLPGVRVEIAGHPEHGYTLSREDGRYDLALNGGGDVAVRFRKNGFLPVQRVVGVPWADFLEMPSVALVALDAAVTDWTLGSATSQVALASPVLDGDGARQAVMVLPAGTSAELVMADGSRQAVPALHVRATEYTVGTHGVEAMPAELPPTSGYTYALELSADEALAADATGVQFSAPLAFYVDDFLGFPAGSPVPAGRYQPELRAWVAQPDGRVVKVLAVHDGTVDLDVTGDDVAEDAAALAVLGITEDERAHLATLYAAGKVVWRVSLDHFSSWDLNYPVMPKEVVQPPLDVPQPQTAKPECAGMYGTLLCENQVLQESLPVVGTPYRLHYTSQGVPGREAERQVVIPLTGPSVPASLEKVRLVVGIMGQYEVHWFTAAPNLSYTFSWDGKDVYGRRVLGEHQASIEIMYQYPVYYRLPAAANQSFGLPAGAPVPGYLLGPKARHYVEVSSRDQVTLASWDSRGVGVGGWMLDAHHVYDPGGHVLHQGDGTTRHTGALGPVTRLVAGLDASSNRGYSGDNGPATQAMMNRPNGMAVGPDGTLYIADGGNYRVRKVTPDGIITTVAGNGTSGFTGDGGPAVNASLAYPSHVALAPDGSLLILAMVLRKVTPDGIITTVAGDPALNTTSGDGGPATQAGFSNPYGLAVAADGTIFIGDDMNLRRVGTDGIITTVAGGTRAYENDPNGDGSWALQAGISAVEDVCVARDGSVYFADVFQNRIRRVRPDGIIETVAGNGSSNTYSSHDPGDGLPALNVIVDTPEAVHCGRDGNLYFSAYDYDYGMRVRVVTPDGMVGTIAGGGGGEGPLMAGNGGPAAKATIWQAYGMALGPDKAMYITDASNAVVHRVSSPFPGDGSDLNLGIPSEDGTEWFIFDPRGRHLRTHQASTGQELRHFTYDAQGRLETIVEARRGTTRIVRDADGKPASIQAPLGQETALAQDGNGFLASVTNPASETVLLTHSAKGLLQNLTGDRGDAYGFTYDLLGRAVTASHPDGGGLVVNRLVSAPNRVLVERVTTEGVKTTVDLTNPRPGVEQRVVTLPDGTTQSTTRSDLKGTLSVAEDGTRTQQDVGPDPRVGMLAPTGRVQEVTLPSGTKSTLQAARTATFATPGDPLSVTRLQDITYVFKRVRSGATFSNAWVQQDKTVQDLVARTITRTSPVGRVETTLTNAWGQEVERRPPGRIPTFTSYDALGRISTVTQGTGTDTRLTTFAYDAQGYLESLTDAENRTVRWTYDAAGRAETATLPDGALVQFTHDASGNLTSVTPPGRPAHRVGYSLGNKRVSVTPPAVNGEVWTTQYFYDRDRRETRTLLPDDREIISTYGTDGRLATVTSGTDSLTYAYGANPAAPWSITTQDGQAVAYTRDGSLLRSVAWTGPVTGSLTYTQDNAGLNIAVQVNALPAVAYEYDKDNILVKAGELTLTPSIPDGLQLTTVLGVVTDTAVLSGFGELASTLSRAAGTEVYSAGVTRDRLGRITEITETVNGALHTTGYSYDLRGQLTEVRVDGSVTESYAYDAHGNRTSVTRGAGPALTADVDAQDRLTRHGTTTYGLDILGQRTSALTGTASTVYGWDVFGHLRSVTLPTGDVVSYVLDGQGRRVQWGINGTPARGYLYDSRFRVAAELDGSNAVLSRFIYGQGTASPLYMVKGGRNYRFIYDPRGSPRLVVDTVSGAVVQELEFDGFGRLVRDTNPGFQPFGFAGGLWDAATGLVHFGHRDYDPETGRWTSKDPLGVRGGETNLYLYVGNDPVNDHDPSGLGSSHRSLPITALAEAWNRYRPNLDTRASSPDEVARVLGRSDLTRDELTEIDHINTSMGTIQAWFPLRDHDNFVRRGVNNAMRFYSGVIASLIPIGYEAGKWFDQTLNVDAFGKVAADTGTFRTADTSCASWKGLGRGLQGIWMGVFSNSGTGTW